MSTMVFVNFPVSDVNRSAAFYEKLGFAKITNSQTMKLWQWFGMITFGLCC